MNQKKFCHSYKLYWEINFFQIAIFKIAYADKIVVLLTWFLLLIVALFLHIFTILMCFYLGLYSQVLILVVHSLASCDIWRTEWAVNPKFDKKVLQIFWDSRLSGWGHDLDKVKTSIVKIFIFLTLILGFLNKLKWCNDQDYEKRRVYVPGIFGQLFSALAQR